MAKKDLSKLNYEELKEEKKFIKYKCLGRILGCIVILLGMTSFPLLSNTANMLISMGITCGILFSISDCLEKNNKVLKLMQYKKLYGNVPCENENDKNFEQHIEKMNSKNILNNQIEQFKQKIEDNSETLEQEIKYFNEKREMFENFKAEDLHNSAMLKLFIFLDEIEKLSSDVINLDETNKCDMVLTSNVLLKILEVNKEAENVNIEDLINLYGIFKDVNPLDYIKIKEKISNGNGLIESIRSNKKFDFLEDEDVIATSRNVEKRSNTLEEKQRKFEERLENLSEEDGKVLKLTPVKKD